MKKLLALMLALVMLFALVACNNKPVEETDEPTTPVVEESPTPDVVEPDEDPVTVSMWFCGSNNVLDDTAVVEKVNEYLLEKINVQIEPIWGSWADFEETKVVTAINGGDDVDIYFTCSWTQNDYIGYTQKGAYLRLDDPDNDLLAQYAPELMSLLPEVLTEVGAKIQGPDGYGVYAVPGYKDIATQNCWDVNVDMLEKYGFTLEDVENADYYSFGDMFKAVKEGEGADFYPLLIEGGVLERMVTNSIIVTGDESHAMLSYYLNPDDVTQPGSLGLKIENKFATEEYKKFVEQTREYYQAGYIDPQMTNSETASDARVAHQNAATYLIGTQSYALGYEFTASDERGIHVEMVPCTDAYVDTTSAQGAMFAISSTSQNPEAAMKLLNIINTDPVVMNMLNYGLEGVHYNLEDGLVKFTDERDNYNPWRNGMGNITLLTPTDKEGADFWDEFKAYYGGAKEIPLLGFFFDNKAVETEVAACVNVVSSYSLSLSSGAVDPATVLPEFLEKLEEAGIQKILDECNAQLEAFLAAKG
ncbi:ABC transporter substrate-binding protein [Clostridiaceae bacterium OttesenSCG-928-D20]|nr:ABC transporter substrate-binding protein [Clostridiaceae bacterium OttesenSCG-928-D20]